MEGELIIVSIISMFGMLLSLFLMQRFWDHKWEMNFDFEKWKLKHYDKRQRAARQFKIKHPEPKTVVNKAMDLIPLLNSLDTNQIKELAEKFLGNETSVDEDNISDVIGNLISGVDPNLIKGFLSNIKKGKSEEGSEDFWT